MPVCNPTSFAYRFRHRHAASLRLVLPAMIAGLLAAAVASQATADPRRPNIVLILADDLGWRNVGCYGSPTCQTPHIDRLARQGVRFTDAYAACHVCSPTRASILTGRYPARLHLTNYIPGNTPGRMRPPDWRPYLPLDEVTIAEALAPHGYRCGHFGKWHLNRNKNYRAGRPMDPGSQGFHEVLTTRKPTRDARPEADAHHVRQITDAAIDFIRRHANRPFFCYVSHNSVHRPILADPKRVAQHRQRLAAAGIEGNATYAAMVDDLDQSVGRLAAVLDELDLADSTLLIFTSDNGAFLGDEKDRGTSNAPLRGGKGTNYEGGIRVPLIVRWPGIARPGSVCHEPVISNDLFPTMLEAATRTPHTALQHPIDGQSLVPLLRQPNAGLDREALFWHYPHYHSQGATPHGAVRQGDWKLIEFYEDMHVELYNLAADLGEQHDLASQQPQRAAALRRLLHTWRNAVGAQMPTAR